MNRQLRVAVADDERDMLDFLEDALVRLGHVVVAAVDNGQRLVEECQAQRPDLVITDIKMPEMDGLQAAAEIYRHAPVPVVILSAYNNLDYVERADQSHVLAYLVKPIKESSLGPAIAIATRRFEEFQALRKEAADLRQALEDRKVIERAKGILMRQAKLDEDTAFRRLQKLASSNNQKLADVARMIVTTAAALMPSTEDH